MAIIIEWIKQQLTNPLIIPFILFVVAFIVFTFKFWGISIGGTLGRVNALAQARLERLDSRRTRNQWQLDRIGVKRNRYYRIYSLLLSGVIESYGLINMTVFKFNVLFGLFGALIFAVTLWFMESTFIAILIAIPAVAALFALVVSGSKSRVRALNLNVMSFLDVVCPLMGKGLLSALKTALPSAHPSIRGSIQTCINRIEHQGMPVRAAMSELADRLGVTFIDFARKAILYEEDQQEGMAESFMDIPEINKNLRIDMIHTETVFSRVNFDMYGRIGIISALVLFSNFYPMTAETMRNTFIGPLTNSVTILCCILIYVVSQMMQVGMDLSKELNRSEK